MLIFSKNGLCPLTPHVHSLYVCLPGPFAFASLLLQAELPAYARKKGRFHKGSIAGLRAWAVARLVEVKQPHAAGGGGAGSSKRSRSAAPSSSSGSAVPSKLLLQRFYRPEDISRDTAYK